MKTFAATFISKTTLENLNDSLQIFEDEFSFHFNEYNLNLDLLQEITTTTVTAKTEKYALEILEEEWFECYDPEDLQILYIRELGENENLRYDFKVSPVVIKKLIKLYPNNTKYIQTNNIDHHGVFTMLSSKRIVDSLVLG